MRIDCVPSRNLHINTLYYGCSIEFGIIYTNFPSFIEYTHFQEKSLILRWVSFSMCSSMPSRCGLSMVQQHKASRPTAAASPCQRKNSAVRLAATPTQIILSAAIPSVPGSLRRDGGIHPDGGTWPAAPPPHPRRQAHPEWLCALQRFPEDFSPHKRHCGGS